MADDLERPDALSGQPFSHEPHGSPETSDKAPTDGASDRPEQVAEAASMPPAPVRPGEEARPVEPPPTYEPRPADGPRDEPWAWRPFAPANSNRYRDEMYADVPASLELSYTATDLGLSAGALDRGIPYAEAERRRPRRNTGARVRRVGRELAETLVLALLIFFAVKAVVQNFRVEGASMEPTLHTEQYLLVNKAIYFRVDMDRVHQFLPFIPGGDNEKHLFRPPQRGDVVVFRFPLDPSRDFIKRVIGVPGDTVEVRDATVFINGAPLEEDYIKDPPNYTYGPKTVPEGAYFVLGDNRRNSYDSHAWCAGRDTQQICDFVPEEYIIGQAWLTYWPLGALGLVDNRDINPQAP